MDKWNRGYAYIGASLVAVIASGAVQAQDSGSAVGGEEADIMFEEIVVSARRKFESLQDVPLVVEALTAETIDKHNLTQFDDIQKVVPGLSMTQDSEGLGTNASMRGVNFDLNASGNNGTVEFYYNDAPISAAIVYAAMFDVGQVEVLRGPQGRHRQIRQGQSRRQPRRRRHHHRVRLETSPMNPTAIKARIHGNVQGVAGALNHPWHIDLILPIQGQSSCATAQPLAHAHWKL